MIESLENRRFLTSYVTPVNVTVNINENSLLVVFSTNVDDDPKVEVTSPNGEVTYHDWKGPLEIIPMSRGKFNVKITGDLKSNINLTVIGDGYILPIKNNIRNNIDSFKTFNIFS